MSVPVKAAPLPQVAHAIVCASCPEIYHDRVSKICIDRGIQKAFGKSGDMVTNLKGRDWVGKWQAKVVMAVVTKARTMNVRSCKILCIQGGPHCDIELSHQPLLVRAIIQEMGDESFRVQVLWLHPDDFFETYDLNLNKPNSLPSAASVSSKVNQTSSKISNEATASSSKVAASKIEMHICGECSKQFASVESLTQHQTATSHKSVGCADCNKTFSNDKKLSQHRSLCRTASESSRKPSDNKDNKDRTKVVENSSNGKEIKKKEQESTAVWRCGECERDFYSEHACSQHQEATGHNDPECGTCGKTFLSIQSLEQHCDSTGHFAGYSNIAIAPRRLEALATTNGFVRSGGSSFLVEIAPDTRLLHLPAFHYVRTRRQALMMVLAMSTAELKRHFSTTIDFTKCLEKSEMIDLITKFYNIC